MGGKGLPPELMKEHDADILLCRNLGPRALNLCRDFGIDVFVCETDTVKRIFDLWKNKKIQKADYEDVCEEHRL